MPAGRSVITRRSGPDWIDAHIVDADHARRVKSLNGDALL